MSGATVHQSRLLSYIPTPPSERYPPMAPATDLRCGIVTPAPASDDLEVITFDLDAGPDAICEFATCLIVEERRRADRFARERDRRRFVAARGHLRRLLSSRIGLPPSDIELEYGPHGKPRLSRRMPRQELRFSVSRSEDVAVVALSLSGDIGVDIEALRPVPEADAIASLCFSAPDYASYLALPPESRMSGFLERWTRLEALCKAEGCGLGLPPPNGGMTRVARRIVPKSGFVGAVVL